MSENNYRSDFMCYRYGRLLLPIVFVVIIYLVLALIAVLAGREHALHWKRSFIEGT